MQTAVQSVLAAPRRASLPARARRAAPSARRSLAPRAAAKDEGDRKLDFAPSSRAGLGYTSGDSAGQSNIFAVEPKTYVAGSSADKTDTSVANKYVATGAAMALVLGLLVARFSSPVDYSYANPRTLTEYAQQFSAEQ